MSDYSDDNMTASEEDSPSATETEASVQASSEDETTDIPGTGQVLPKRKTRDPRSNIPFSSTAEYKKLDSLLNDLVSLEALKILAEFDSGLYQDESRKERTKQLLCDCNKKFKSQQSYKAHKQSCSVKFEAAVRIPCVLTGCSKTFLNVPGISYHLKNYLHGLDELENSKVCTKEMVNEIKSISVPAEYKDGFNIEFTMKLGQCGRQFTRSVRFDLKESDVEHSEVRKHSLKSSVKKQKSKGIVLVPVTEPQSCLDISGVANNFRVSNEGRKGQDTADLMIKFQDTVILVNNLTSVRVGDAFVCNTGIHCTALDCKGSYLLAGGSAKGKLHLAGENLQCENEIQIWKIESADVILKASLKHAFGDVLQAQWCKNSTESTSQIGLIAATFTDGYLRVFVCPRSDNDGSQCN